MWLLLPLLLFGGPETDFSQGKQELPGFYNLYWDSAEGGLFLGIDRFDEQFLFINSLVTGLGSNDLGLDRGQLGKTRLVSFKRVGKKVFMIEPNLDYRAISENADERRAVRESFAYSILWGSEIVAQDEHRVYVDLSSLVFRDEQGIMARLERQREGRFSIDSSRSHYVRENIKSFPANLEIQVALTFTGKPEGPFVPTVTPTASSFTLEQRMSFLKLPDDGYQARSYHPASGGFSKMWKDYAAPLDADLEQLFVFRHHLKRKDPKAPRSELVEPLVYYVDNGAPPEIQKALIEGASWWKDAFEAAGIIDGFRVEVMPEGMDPMDARYNVIQWVHRATRGWSYGGSVSDPRTGEIIKGHVTLGSLRVRQDRLIFEGILPTDEQGNYSQEPYLNPVQLSLARIRQLAAHEVGHTLGLAHNFAASSFGRCSVMDYPAPLIKLENGEIDCSDAYAVGIGEWDKLQIRYLYGAFEDEQAGLEALITEASQKGILFIDDIHGRAVETMHPQAHVWDNGSDNIAEFERVLQVRNHILAGFGPHNMHPHKFRSRLEEALTPVYLHHRYQLNACAKSVGGALFNYGRNGGENSYIPESPGRQRKAMSLLLTTLSSSFLDLPTSLQSLIPPAPPGYEAHREYFQRRTGDSFDDLALAETATSLTLDALLAPERVNRVYNQHALDAKQPGVQELVSQLLKVTALAPEKTGREAVFQRMTAYAAVSRLLDLAGNGFVRDDARAQIYRELDLLNKTFEKDSNNSDYSAFRLWIRNRIRQAATSGSLTEIMPLAIPPGSPIGGGNPK